MLSPSQQCQTIPFIIIPRYLPLDRVNVNNNNNNNNNTHDNFYSAVIMTTVITRVHSVHLMNVDQRQAAVDPQTKPPDLGCESACLWRWWL